MLIVIIEDVEISETIYYEATKLFVSQEVTNQTLKLLGVTTVLMLSLIISVVALSHLSIVKPIMNLTELI